VSGVAKSVGTCKKLGGRCVPSTRSCQHVISKAKCLAGKTCCATQAIAERQFNKKVGREKIVNKNPAGKTPTKIKNKNKPKKGKIGKKTKKTKKKNKLTKGKVGRKTNKIKNTNRPNNIKIYKKTRKIQKIKDDDKRTRKIQGNRNNKGDKGNGNRTKKVEERKERNQEIK
ncbi:unnamed protein product, partial [Meganyctiphanes norvegica]